MTQEYEHLAYAIVKQAVDDYCSALSGRCENTRYVIKECERFFRSELMYLYAPGVDGEAVIATLQKRYTKSLPSYYEENK